MHKIIGGVLLVIGTAIGAGMLALPLATARLGFYPSIMAFGICFYFMTYSAFLLLEASVWFSRDTNIISMSRKTLGQVGKVVSGVIYLLLLYALLSLYLKAGTAWLIQMLAPYCTFLPTNYVLGFLAVFFGLIIFAGMKTVDYLNRYLAGGLLCVYGSLLILCIPHIDPVLLENVSFQAIGKLFPILITSFGFGIIIPSLNTYLHGNIKHLRRIILMGSICTLAIYIAWELVTLGVVPLIGPINLLNLAKNHDDGTGAALALQQMIGSPIITFNARLFAILAILTSFLGVAISLFHFLADGLQLLPKQAKIRLSLIGLTFIPPLLFITLYPTGFEKILSYAGILVALLLGILPSCIVWSGRYHLQIISSYRVIGGKGHLVMNVLFFIGIIMVELY